MTDLISEEAEVFKLFLEKAEKKAKQNGAPTNSIDTDEENNGRDSQ